ncbi:MAG: hypothetical protein KC431_00690, partial [Myxococcales bacterium]|nr:hypothetical protein [Myxococcales bacterium]
MTKKSIHIASLTPILCLTMAVGCADDSGGNNDEIGDVETQGDTTDGSTDTETGTSDTTTDTTDTVDSTDTTDTVDTTDTTDTTDT